MGDNFDRSRRWFLKRVGVASGIAGASLGVIQIGCSSEEGNASAGGTGGDGIGDGGTTVPGDASDRLADAGGESLNSGDGTADSLADDDSVENTDIGENEDGGIQEDTVGAEDTAGNPDGEVEADASSSDAETEADASASEPDSLVESDTSQMEPDGGQTTDNCEITGSDVKGPFYEEGAPFTNQLADAEEVGVRIRIEGTVYEPDCTTPIPGALLDIWQADNEGEYHSAEEEYRLRGQILADDDGRYAFESILPGRYAMSGSFRPAHIHFTISKPGFVPVTTQMYFEGDPYLAPNDPCGGCNSGDETQIVPMEPGEGNIEQAGVFDIVLAKG